MSYRNSYNKTKIVATIGPASSSYEMLKQLVITGVDICRLNFSHGSYDDHQKVLDNIKKINEELNSHIGILLDLQGPKLRVGEMENGEVTLEKGKEIEVTSKEVVGTAQKIYVHYEFLTKDIDIGHRILIDDGKIELKITEKVDRNTVKAKIIHGGQLKSRKGFNLPSTNLSIPSITQKDIEDLEFGLKNEVDWIGMSFVRRPEEVHEIKNTIWRHQKRTRVLAKIEKPEAVQNIDSIIEVADAIMIARGDLGVEMPMEEVPVIQKNIVKKCLAASKPVIIATQMMESMITSPSPTRAEANDVANAVIDGADAVMLSAETSIGAYPLQAVEAMVKIVRHIEQQELIYFKNDGPSQHESRTYITDVICFTAARMSMHIPQAKAIASMTRSGYTAFKLASFRPKADIFVFTNNKSLLNQLNLVWGIRGYFYDKFETTDNTIHDVNKILKEDGHVKLGEMVINTASMPIHKKSMTNAVKITLITNDL